MRVLKFAWHLFWAARRCPGERLGQLLWNADWVFDLDESFTTIYYRPDTELTEALRRYGR